MLRLVLPAKNKGLLVKEAGCKPDGHNGEEERHRTGENVMEEGRTFSGENVNYETLLGEYGDGVHPGFYLSNVFYEHGYHGYECHE